MIGSSRVKATQLILQLSKQSQLSVLVPFPKTRACLSTATFPSIPKAKAKAHVAHHASFLSTPSILRMPFGTGTRPSIRCSSTTTTTPTNIGTIDSSPSNPAARFYLSFTCGVCSGSNSYTISKQAYYHGVVITTCHHCKNNHLIADNLDWFQDPHGKNIEEILAAKGETVRKFIGTGTNEYTPNSPEEAELKRIE